MADDRAVATDSWKHYRDCVDRIEEFLREVSVKDSEVWIGDVCFGSPDRAWISARLQVNSAEVVIRAIERTKGLVAVVRDCLEETVETSKRVMEDLRRQGARESELAGVVGRIDVLERL